MLRKVEMEMSYTCDLKPCVYSTRFEFKNVLPFNIYKRYSIRPKKTQNILTLSALTSNTYKLQREVKHFFFETVQQ